jgi:hypothetical protein
MYGICCGCFQTSNLDAVPVSHRRQLHNILFRFFLYYMQPSMPVELTEFLKSLPLLTAGSSVVEPRRGAPSLSLHREDSLRSDSSGDEDALEMMGAALQEQSSKARRTKPSSTAKITLNAGLMVNELVPHLRGVQTEGALVRYFLGMACFAGVPLDRETANRLQSCLYSFVTPGGTTRGDVAAHACTLCSSCTSVHLLSYSVCAFFGRCRVCRAQLPVTYRAAYQQSHDGSGVSGAFRCLFVLAPCLKAALYCLPCAQSCFAWGCAEWSEGSRGYLRAIPAFASLVLAVIVLALVQLPVDRQESRRDVLSPSQSSHHSHDHVHRVVRPRPVAPTSGAVHAFVVTSSLTLALIAL